MSLAEAWQALQDVVVAHAWRAAGAALLLMAGLLVALLVGRLAAWLLSRRPSVSRAAAFFLPRIAHLAVVIATVALALEVLGVAGPVIGVVVTVGLALGVIPDIGNGLRVLGWQPFNIGDVIEFEGIGLIGVVSEVRLTATILRTRNDTEVFIPNRKLFDHIVINHSVSPAKVLRFRLTATSVEDVDLCEAQIRAAIAKASPVASRSPVEIHLIVVEEDALTFTIQLRAPPFEAEQVASAVIKAVRVEFDAAGFVIRHLALASQSPD